ncbi:FAD-dependent oxidoreductase [Pseudonocardia sp. ICBG1122]|nr:FAD-dependent oxidoreductase [Pseudonocardia pini]
MVTTRGEFAVRGGILDIFPPTAEHPVRVEFWGDEVSEVRSFSVADQRSVGEVTRIDVPPCRELLLTTPVRERAGELALEQPETAGLNRNPLRELLEKLSEGIPGEGMESLIPALVGGEMQTLTDLLPDGTRVLLADPERIRTRCADLVRIRALWAELVEVWDDRTFYDFVSTSKAFSDLSFAHREAFGQVGFGTGGWDSDFPNSMLEILRVVLTGCDDDQLLVVGGVEQVPQGLWTRTPDDLVHWPAGTSLSSLHGGGTRPGVARLHRLDADTIRVTDVYGGTRDVPAVLTTCQSWLLSTQIDTDESLFGQEVWMALDRTRYMQSTKTFVMVDRPFWRDVDPATGREVMSTTLTDRLTRSTYLFDNGPDRPGVICLSYSWMSDSLKMLPYPVEKRVELALGALRKIYPTVDVGAHVIGDPITVTWESDPHSLGAFKGALPGHYRYNRRMYCHFVQDDLPAAERGIFMAGDDVSWTPAWAEGAVQTALNAVWGIVAHLGGSTPPDNPGPGTGSPSSRRPRCRTDARRAAADRLPAVRRGREPRPARRGVRRRGRGPARHPGDVPDRLRHRRRCGRRARRAGRRAVGGRRRRDRQDVGDGGAVRLPGAPRRTGRQRRRARRAGRDPARRVPQDAPVRRARPSLLHRLGHPRPPS